MFEIRDKKNTKKTWQPPIYNQSVESKQKSIAFLCVKSKWNAKHISFRGRHRRSDWLTMREWITEVDNDDPLTLNLSEENY